jgi:hypothetical protein
VRRQALTHLPKIAPTKYRVGFPWHGLDLRSEDGRFLGRFIGDIVSDLGGAETLSRAQITLIERASFYALKVCEFETANLVPGSLPYPPWTHGEYNSAVVTLRRILLDLGLHRRARDVPRLHEYIAQATQKAQDTRSQPTPEVVPE